MFLVSLLHVYHPVGTVPPPSSILKEGEEEFEVDMILDHETRLWKTQTSHEYLVNWLCVSPTCLSHL